MPNFAGTAARSTLQPLPLVADKLGMRLPIPLARHWWRRCVARHWRLCLGLDPDLVLGLCLGLCLRLRLGLGLGVPRAQRLRPSPRLQRLAWLLAAACAASTAGADPLGDQVLAEVNRYRANLGLPSLQADARLQAIAGAHSDRMARQGRLSHAGFAQRFEHSGAQLCVENLAAGSVDAAAVVAAWHASPEHRRNLQQPDVRAVGLGRTGPVISLLACRFDGP